MSLSHRDKILLLVVLTAAVVAGGWYFLIRPAQDDVSVKQEQLAAVEAEVGQRNDEVARLSASTESHTAKTVERLWLAKAVPVSDQTPGAVVELQRLADRSGVELAAVRTTTRTAYGPLEGTSYEVDIVGRFYNVDDFLYRIHSQVELDRGDSPDIEGRLYATTKVDIGLEAQLGSGASPGTQLAPNDVVRATVTVVAFGESAAPAVGADGTVTQSPTVGGDPAGAAGDGSAAAAPDSGATQGGSTQNDSGPTGGGGTPQGGAADQQTATPNGGGVTQ